MKTKIPLFIIASLLSHSAIAQNSATVENADENNLLQNPGFEAGEYVNIQTKYSRLVERGIQFPTGDPALMPEGVKLNADELSGWPAVDGNGFEYVEGKPEEDVHTGEYAIKIISQTEYSPIIIASRLSPNGLIPVSESTAHDDQSIQPNQPYIFSFYAKGHGKVMVTSYCYDAERQNIYSTDTDKLIAVEPEIVEVTDAQQWEKFEGTIEVLSPKVSNLSFVIRVLGEVSLDDVMLVRQEKP